MEEYPSLLHLKLPGGPVCHQPSLHNKLLPEALNELVDAAMQSKAILPMLGEVDDLEPVLICIDIDGGGRLLLLLGCT